MGVFTERLAVLLLLPWSSRGASSISTTDSRRTYGTLDEASAPSPTWKLGREHSPSSSVQRADLEALRAFSRVR
jgi:hypothetical protein